MKSKKIKLFASFCFLFIGLTVSTKKAESENIKFVHQTQKYSVKNEEDVLDYTTVLNSYYELAIGDAEKPTETFEQFYDSYYSESSDRNLYRFTLQLAKENNNYTNVYASLFSTSGEDGISTASSGGGAGGGASGEDADYILKDSSNYSYTPSSAFGRKPYYSVYDYSAVQTGDIVWETETIFFNAGHTALITNKNHDSANGSYIETIEAVGGGVQRGFLDDLRMTAYKCKILRVIGRNDINADSSIYFATSQVGKTYSLNTFRLNTSINSTKWYCSELVYACWKYAGIDIGVKKEDGKDVCLSMGCMPSDINNSYNTKTISMPYYGFLSFAISSKIGNIWRVKITNTSSEELEVSYNIKMCYLKDAKNWTGLSDLNTLYISSYSTVTVSISENWFATSIAASYVRGNYRIITYADQLSTDGLSVYQNVIENDQNK